MEILCDLLDGERAIADQAEGEGTAFSRRRRSASASLIPPGAWSKLEWMTKTWIPDERAALRNDARLPVTDVAGVQRGV